MNIGEKEAREVVPISHLKMPVPVRKEGRRYIGGKKGRRRSGKGMKSLEG